MFSQCAVHNFSKQLETNERSNEMKKREGKRTMDTRKMYVYSSQRYGSLGVQMVFHRFFFWLEKYTLVIFVVVLRYDTKSKWHYNTELNIIQFYYVQFFSCTRSRLSSLLRHLRSFPLLLLMALAVYVRANHSGGDMLER